MNIGPEMKTLIARMVLDLFIKCDGWFAADNFGPIVDRCISIAFDICCKVDKLEIPD